MIKIGFTSTRQGLTLQQGKLFTLLVNDLKIREFHHGDCTGGDETAHHWILGKCNIIIHPPVDERHRANCSGYPDVTILDPLPYHERNRAIVDATSMLIACPKTHSEEVRSGTWSTIRYARKMGKPVIILV